MSQMKQEWQGEVEEELGGVDGERVMEGCSGTAQRQYGGRGERSCVPARRPAPGGRFQGHEIGSGK